MSDCQNHDSITTPYCPLCGANVNSDPLASLLAHVKGQAVIQKRWLDRVSDNRKKAEPGSRLARMFDKKMKVYRKWESWGLALERMRARNAYLEDEHPGVLEEASDA
jgi:hypothetical protein